MSARRDKIAPFEIMGRTGLGGGAPGAGEGPAADPVPVEEPVGRPGAGGGGGPVGNGAAPLAWWRGGSPIILRVPRGMALLAGVGLLGLIVLAYWVGYTRGTTAAEVMDDPARPRNYQLPAVRGGGLDGAAGAGVAAGTGRDAGENLPVERQEGLGYLIVATYPHEEARRLQAFLAERGVATTLERHDNERSRVRCLRGFDPNDVDARRQFRESLLEHGRAWRRHNNNRGHDLSDAYWSPF